MPDGPNGHEGAFLVPPEVVKPRPRDVGAGAGEEEEEEREHVHSEGD